MAPLNEAFNKQDFVPRLGMGRRRKVFSFNASDTQFYFNGTGGYPRDRWLNVSLDLSIRNKPQPNFI
jgi:hypothetical protein